jgi:hypothetical protein
MDARGALTYWPRAWCASFRYGCLPMFPLSLFVTPKKPPQAKIIVFHGVPKPQEAVARAPWIAEHWC